MDQGRDFESRLFKSICEIFQIHKSGTAPYRPSANEQVERFNITLMDAVRCWAGSWVNSTSPRGPLPLLLNRASIVKPIIAGIALDHQTTVIGFLAGQQDFSIFCL
jgi:transposase InsO family protein